MWKNRRLLAEVRWGMLSRLMNFLRACWRPSSDRYVHTSSDTAGRQDGLLWYKDSGQHLNGEFSMAVVQANNLLEDQSQLESGSLSTLDSGPYGTFIGIYDGHGGPETSRYINDHLFQHLKSKKSKLERMLLHNSGCWAWVFKKNLQVPLFMNNSMTSFLYVLSN